MPCAKMAPQVTVQPGHDAMHNVARNRTSRVRTRPPFEWIALLLQGGGAFAAYQAGVYQAPTLDWAAAISIGAINSAIIAPEEGVELKRPSAGDKHELGQHLTPR